MTLKFTIEVKHQASEPRSGSAAGTGIVVRLRVGGVKVEFSFVENPAGLMTGVTSVNTRATRLFVSELMKFSKAASLKVMTSPGREIKGPTIIDKILVA